MINESVSCPLHEQTTVIKSFRGLIQALVVQAELRSMGGIRWKSEGPGDDTFLLYIVVFIC